ncbi:MAG TPA: phosphatase PAP2 family protein [Chloroflexota bacterium]
MHRNKLIDWDRRIYSVLQGRLRAGWANRPMILITQSGTKGTIWLIIAAVVFVAGGAHGRHAAALSVASLLLAEGIINLVLKPAIARERPYGQRGPGRLRTLLVKAPGPHSWPSAHAGASMAAAVVLSVYYPQFAPVFLALAVLIAYSRVYVGVHFPLDVLAGSAIGAICAATVLTCSLVLSPLHLPVVSGLVPMW